MKPHTALAFLFSSGYWEWLLLFLARLPMRKSVIPLLSFSSLLRMERGGGLRDRSARVFIFGRGGPALRGSEFPFPSLRSKFALFFLFSSFRRR